MSSEPQTAGALFARISRVPSIARAATGSHVFLYRLTGGALGGRLLNAPVMLVTTTGRKTGKQHTTPLVYLPDGDRFLVIASNGGQGKLPNWWLNMRASKHASIEIGRRHLQVSAQEADPAERQQLWPGIVTAVPAYGAYQRRMSYPIPVVILRPAE